jgi:hypothetical protein
MKNMQKFTFAVIAALILISTVMASGKTRAFRGTIVAFDPSYHSLKQASFVKNIEVTIADVGGKPGNQTFVKLIFEGFGTEQVPDDVLSGQTPFSLRAVRDKSCDEAHPHLVSKVDPFEGSGAFLLNQTHQTQSLDMISHLDCYRAQIEK